MTYVIGVDTGGTFTDLVTATGGEIMTPSVKAWIQL